MKHIRAAVWWAGLSAAAVALACEPSDQTPAGRGARVFQRSCSGCHGANGRGVMRLGLTKPPRDLTQSEFHENVTDEQLRAVIRTGKGQMPAFGGLLGDSDIRAVIAFIRTLPPPGTRTPEAPAPTSAASLPGDAHEQRGRQ